jgi:hypothetical protein
MQVMSIAAHIPLHGAFSLTQILFMVLLYPGTRASCLTVHREVRQQIAVWGPTIDHDIRTIEDEMWCNYKVGTYARV